MRSGVNSLGRWVRRRARAAAVLLCLAGTAWGAASDGLPPLGGTVVRPDGQSLALFVGDGGFRWFHVGEEVAPGVRIAEVKADRVVMRRESGGEFQVLLWTDRPASRGAAPPPRVVEEAVIERAPDPETMSAKDLDHRKEQIREQFRDIKAFPKKPEVPEDVDAEGGGRVTEEKPRAPRGPRRRASREAPPPEEE